jgi:hypothetical protein
VVLRNYCHCQGILEGKSYFNKKSGEYVESRNWFQIVATANTKGRGSEEGRPASKILDDAISLNDSQLLL